jgi:hypothetical protein
MTKPERFSFEVLPSDMDGGSFDPFILEVPSLMGIEPAARRAWFSALAMLANIAEPEDFKVLVVGGPKSGTLVNSEGLVS